MNIVNVKIGDPFECLVCKHMTLGSTYTNICRERDLSYQCGKSVITTKSDVTNEYDDEFQNSDDSAESGSSQCEEVDETSEASDESNDNSTEDGDSRCVETTNICQYNPEDYCTNCNSHYVLCKWCSDETQTVLCRLTGHYGWKDDETMLLRNPLMDPPVVECNGLDDDSEMYFNMEDDDMMLYIPYYCGDLHLYYLDNISFIPTGPTGSFDHYWICDKCDYSFNDTNE
jgi:hypothetical protein